MRVVYLKVSHCQTQSNDISIQARLDLKHLGYLSEDLGNFIFQYYTGTTCSSKIYYEVRNIKNKECIYVYVDLYLHACAENGIGNQKGICLENHFYS